MSHRTLAYIAVFIGGAFGSALRHAVNQAAASLFGVKLPWGTLAVNISGSLAMGLITGWFAFRNDSSQLFRLFITTGIAGGFTTFSAFALDTALLWERGQYGIAALYSLSSVVVSIAAVFAGINVVRYL